MSFFSTHASIKPSRIVVYSKWNGSRNYNNKGLSLNNAEKKVLSYKSSKRMRDAIEALIYTSKWKHVRVKSTNKTFWYKNNFITLTLSSKQQHSDQFIVQELLSKFLEAWCKRRAGLLYVWKAEVQDNGNIHFHITTNTFIYWKDLKDRWNKYLKRHGYKENMNSTDVHAVEDKENLAKYLCSYFSKKDLYSRALKRYHKRYGKKLAMNNRECTVLPKNYLYRIKRKLTCKLWGCSKLLLNCKSTSDYNVDSSNDWKLLELLKDKGLSIDSDYSSMFLLESTRELSKFFPQFNRLLLNQMAELIKRQNQVQSDQIDTL